MSVLVAVAAALGLLVVTEEPSATWSRASQRLEVAGLPELFEHPEIRDNLETGLSTTVVLSLDARRGDGSRLRFEARARIRYQLWDEVFLVETVGLGESDALGDQALRIASRSELGDWWRRQTVTLPLSEGDQPAQTLRLRIVVLPFSESEEADARLWFSRSVRRAGTGGPGENGGGINTLLEQVMATAIGRQQLLTRDFKIEIRSADDERP